MYGELGTERLRRRHPGGTKKIINQKFVSSKAVYQYFDVI